MTRRRRQNQTHPRHFEPLENRWLLAIDVVAVSPGSLNNPVHPSARAADVSSDLQLTLSRPVVKGSGHVSIRHRQDNTLIESIDVDSNRIRISQATVTIDPITELPPDADVFVTVSPGAFRATSGAAVNAVLLDEDFERLPLRNSFLDIPLDDYVVAVRGELNVQKAGAYTFGVNGDDGQMLSIDVAQDGLDLLDDVLIYDDAFHTAQDRLHTCASSQIACPGTGTNEAITLATGTYPFEYQYFDRGGPSGGEFFYAPGYHESFSDAFVLVGDASQGIGVTAIKATLYKAFEGLSVDSLTMANALADAGFVAVPVPVPVEGGMRSTGTNASFLVNRTNTEYRVELVHAGSDYKVNDRLVIKGKDVGGESGSQASPANDIQLDVLSVTPFGGIDTFSFSGVAEDPLACPGSNESLSSECLSTVDLFDTGDSGRFSDNHAVPGGASWQQASDPFKRNWTEVAPIQWVRDQSQLEGLRPGGPAEYNGWTFLDRDFWIIERGDHQRSRFELGRNTLAVVDPNGYHGGRNINATGDPTQCLATGLPQNCGFYAASLATRRVSLAGAVSNSAVLEFDSSWWNEDTQAAEIWVEYFRADGSSLQNTRLARWDSIPSSPFYKPVVDPNTGIDARNESLRFDLANPTGAATMQVTFSMPHAQNDWWWAIDNVVITADVQGGEPFAGFRDESTWRFFTQPSVSFEAPTIRVNEDVGSILIDVSRVASAANVWPFEVQYQTHEGTATRAELDEQGELINGDFAAPSQSSIRYSGATTSSQSILVTIVDDDLEEGNETFRVSLSNPQVPRVGDIQVEFTVPELVVTIVDDDITTIPGDIDGDGAVAFGDFLILSLNFGQQVEPGKDGDIDGDGRVAFGDFLLLSLNFGRRLAEPVQAAASDQVFATLAGETNRPHDEDEDSQLFDAL